MEHPPHSIPVIIDGPNFINRLLELGIAPVHLARQLRIRGIMEVVDHRLGTIPGITGTCSSAEFVCSPKRFGPNKARFTEDQQQQLLNNIRSEVGVYVDCISIPGSSEKGVDTTIAGRLQDLAGEVQAAVLVSVDRDYIPTIGKLRHKLNVILFSVLEGPPVELQNEAYATIELGEDHPTLFSYSYPTYNMETLDEDKLAILFAETDDRCLNQLRVEYNGDIYMYKGGGTDHLRNVKFRFESFGHYNGYTGLIKASDPSYIRTQLNEIRLGWERGAKGYIDYPIATMWNSRTSTTESQEG